MSVKLTDSRFLCGWLSVHQGTKYFGRATIFICSVCLCCTILALCFFVTHILNPANEQIEEFHLKVVFFLFVVAFTIEISGIFISFYLLQAYRDRKSRGYWLYLFWVAFMMGFSGGMGFVTVYFRFTETENTPLDIILNVLILLATISIISLLYYCYYIVNLSRKMLKSAERRLRVPGIPSVSARTF